MTEACIVEVGPRDGFQPIGPFIPTETKIATIKLLYEAGMRRIEVTSFASTRAVPQMADAVEVLVASLALHGLDSQILAPSAKQAERALASGARRLAFVVSASESHNQNNVRRSVRESAEEFRRIVEMLPKGGAIRLNIATAFDCPFEGRMPEARVLDLAEELGASAPAAEIALCDTTGRADPAQVRNMFANAAARAKSSVKWAFHGHDTYGLGAANAFAAWQAGVRVFDASVAGLGGCPFAPGATGNVATEDLVWMFERMGVATGVNLEALIDVAELVALLPGAQTGGRVSRALRASVCAAPV